MSHEQVTQQQEQTHAFDGPSLQSSSNGGASLPPPPFQLQVSPGSGYMTGTPDRRGLQGATASATAGVQEHGHSGSGHEQGHSEGAGPAANLSSDLLLRIYTAAADAEQARTFVQSLSQPEIRTADTAADDTMRAEAQDHAEHPMNELDRRPNGRTASSQWQNIEWDLPTEDGGGEYGQLDARDTGESAATNRIAFEQHRDLELTRLVGSRVDVSQVLAARRIAASHDSPLAEAVRVLLFTANQYALAQTLNPDQSGRYRPTRLREGHRGRSQTFCNMYVLDMLRAYGVNEDALPGGNANSLNRTLRRRSYRQFWRRIEGGAEVAQARADAGQLVIISAHGEERARRESDEGDGPFFEAGHISIIMAQNEARGAQAGRTEDGTFSPLESNAGGGSQWVGEGADRRPSANWRFQNRADLYESNPDVYLRNRRGQQRNRRVDWWASGHTNGAFYEYVGSLSNPEGLNNGEVMGMEERAAE